MWLTDLANGAFGGAFVAATALLIQGRLENNRAKEERQHADLRAEQDRKDAVEKEQRDDQLNKHAAWREERKIAHTQALSALGAVWERAAHDQITMRLQDFMNQHRKAEEKLEILANATRDSVGPTAWEDTLIEDLRTRINAVAIFGSHESARAAKGVQSAATRVYFFTSELGRGTGITDEQFAQQKQVNSLYHSTVAEYLAAVKADLGTDS